MRHINYVLRPATIDNAKPKDKRYDDVYPAIGDMQLDEVQPGDVLAIIKARADTAVTAERIRVIVQ